MMHLFRDISNKRSLKILCPNILIGTVDYEPFCFVIPPFSLFYAFQLFGRAACGRNGIRKYYRMSLPTCLRRSGTFFV